MVAPDGLLLARGSPPVRPVTMLGEAGPGLAPAARAAFRTSRRSPLRTRRTRASARSSPSAPHRCQGRLSQPPGRPCPARARAWASRSQTQSPTRDTGVMRAKTSLPAHWGCCGYRPVSWLLMLLHLQPASHHPAIRRIARIGREGDALTDFSPIHASESFSDFSP